jgi:LysM repeat protein
LASNVGIPAQPETVPALALPLESIVARPSTELAATSEPLVTATVLSTETPVYLEGVHIYEVTKLPAGTSRGLLVHMVVRGETLDMIASNYGTTVDAILAVNYKLTPPAWVDYPIVVPVDTQDVSGLPAFKVYVVKEYETITAQELAELLDVNAKDLEYYNLCSGDCVFKQEDVLLIPHSP